MAKRRWRDALRAQEKRNAQWEAIRNHPIPHEADRAAFQMATREMRETAYREHDRHLADTIAALRAALVRHSGQQED